MSDEFSQAMFATCAIRILLVIAAVAVAAYTTRSRDVFLGGVIGSLLGLIVPQPIVHYGSGRYASLTAIERAGDHVLAWGIVGAAIGCGLVAFAISKNPRLQFSLKHAIGWMTVIGIVLGLKSLWFS